MIPFWFPTTTINELRLYTNFNKIDVGGFGEIYSATYHQKSKTIPVAIKRLKPIYTKNPSIRKSFENEARFLKMLNHPQIPKFIDGYLSKEECFFIMEFIDGSPLDGLLLKIKALGNTFSLPFAFEVATQISTILSYLHTYTNESGALYPIIHCDIKPHNILITPAIDVFLIDFSIATPHIPNNSHKGGTYRYMSPERFVDETPSPKTDLFGLMLTFFQILTLRPLISGNTIYEIFSNYLTKKYLDDILKEGFPKPIEEIFLKGLAYKPNERFEDAKELKNALNECANRMGLELEKSKLQKILSSFSK
jgi:eukaryotic-like serine/threonine-protein kinase